MEIPHRHVGRKTNALSRKGKPMSKQFIRRLSVLLAVLMLLTCLPTAALAAEFDREDPLMSAVQELAEDGQYVNIAKGKTVTATNGSDTAANAVDGNAATKWQAAPSASIEVDLGSVQRVDKIDLIWAENYPQKFKLYIAGSNKSYTDLGGLEDNSGADFIHEPETAMNIRYIKVEMLEAVAGESLSALAEIEAMQLQAEEQENLALGRPAYASAVEANVPRLGPSGAFDGKWGTYEKPTDTVPVRWASGNTVNAPQWIYVDLEQEREVGSVNICWEYPNADGKGSYATAYKVQYNNDGVDLTNDAAWTELVSVTGANGGWTPHSFAPVKARYIRLYIPQGVGMGMGSGKAVSIWEMQVFAGAVQQGMTMGELVKKLQDEPIEVKAGDTAMPTYTYNNGSLTAEVFCSDNDYVVSDSGEIKTPLVDKTVLITYVVTDQVTGQTQEVRNLPVVIPGAQSQEALRQRHARDRSLPPGVEGRQGRRVHPDCQFPHRGLRRREGRSGSGCRDHQGRRQGPVRL